MIPGTPRMLSIAEDRLAALTALESRQAGLIAAARDAERERVAAVRDLATARQQHAAEITSTRAELAREREAANPISTREREELRAEIGRLRGVVEQYQALGVVMARFFADFDVLRKAFREDGGLR